MNSTATKSSFYKICESVSQIAKEAREQGDTIEIISYLPAIKMTVGGEGYFFERYEAESLIKEAERSKLSNYCSIEDIILWEAQGW